MNINLRYTPPKCCDSHIKFGDLEYDRGIKTHWRITAFFLSCFGKIEELHLGNKIYYLNKADYESWKKRQNTADFRGCQTAKEFVTAACFASYYDKAARYVREGHFSLAFDKLKETAKRTNKAFFSDNVSSLNGWKQKLLSEAFGLHSLRGNFQNLQKTVVACPHIYQKSVTSVRNCLVALDAYRHGQGFDEATKKWVQEQGLKESTDADMDKFLQQKDLDPNLKKVAEYYYDLFKKEQLLINLYEKVRQDATQELNNHNEYLKLLGQYDIALSNLNLEQATALQGQINGKYPNKFPASKAEALRDFTAFVAANECAKVSEATYINTLGKQFRDSEADIRRQSGEQYRYHVQFNILNNQINDVGVIFERFKSLNYQSAIQGEHTLQRVDSQITRYLDQPKTPEASAAEKCADRFVFNQIQARATALFTYPPRILASIRLEEEAEKALLAGDLALAQQKLEQSIKECPLDITKMNLASKLDCVKQLNNWSQQIKNKESLMSRVMDFMTRAQAALDDSFKDKPLTAGAKEYFTNKMRSFGQATQLQDRWDNNHIELHTQCKAAAYKQTYQYLARYEALSDALKEAETFDKELAAAQQAWKIENGAILLLADGKVTECRQQLSSIQVAVPAEKERLQAMQRELLAFEALMALKLPAEQTTKEETRALVQQFEAVFKENASLAALGPIRNAVAVVTKYLQAQQLNGQQIQELAKELRQHLEKFPDETIVKQVKDLVQEMACLSNVPLSLVRQHGSPCFGVRLKSICTSLQAAMPAYVAKQAEVNEARLKQIAEIEQLEKGLISNDLFEKWTVLLSLNPFFVTYLVDNEAILKSFKELHKTVMADIQRFKQGQEIDDNMAVQDLCIDIYSKIANPDGTPKPFLRGDNQELHFDPVRFQKFYNSTIACKIKLIQLRQKQNENDFDMLKVNIEAYKDFLDLYNMLIACLVLLYVTDDTTRRKAAVNILDEKDKLAQTLGQIAPLLGGDKVTILHIIAEKFPLIAELLKVVEKVKEKVKRVVAFAYA